MVRKKEIPLAEGEELAKEFIGLTRDFYERVEIGGSIHRKAPIVHDIDVCAIAKKLVSEYVEAVEKVGGKISRFGGEYATISFKGVQINVLFTTPETLGSGLDVVHRAQGSHDWYEYQSRQSWSEIQQDRNPPVGRRDVDSHSDGGRRGAIAALGVQASGEKRVRRKGEIPFLETYHFIGDTLRRDGHWVIYTLDSNSNSPMMT